MNSFTVVLRKKQSFIGKQFCCYISPFFELYKICACNLIKNQPYYRRFPTEEIVLWKKKYIYIALSSCLSRLNGGFEKPPFIMNKWTQIKSLEFCMKVYVCPIISFFSVANPRHYHTHLRSDSRQRKQKHCKW